jgi:hypothetical protein
MSGYAPRKCAKSQTKSQRPTARRSDARPGRRWCGASIDRPVRRRASSGVGKAEVADEALEASLAEGCLQDDLHDVAVALDALDKLSGPTGAGLPERRRDRDELLNRLQVVSLPTPPLAAPPISEDDATSGSL